MIRVFSGGRYSLRDWEGLALILKEGLNSICWQDCNSCPYSFACREVSQAITFCDKRANQLLANNRSESNGK